MSRIMQRTRVYAPDTNEPFDVTPSKAADLVLEKGWTKSPVLRVVESVALPVESEAEVSEDFEASDDAVEVQADDEDTTWRSGRARGRGRKTFGSDEAVV